MTDPRIDLLENRRAPWPFRLDGDDGAGELSPWPGPTTTLIANTLSYLLGAAITLELGRRYFCQLRPFR